MTETVCTVCGSENQVRFSLPLTRDADGRWTARPTCTSCRNGLLSEARQLGKTIRIFSLIGSTKEAERRNELRGNFHSILSAFEEKGKRNNGRKSHKVHA